MYIKFIYICYINNVSNIKQLNNIYNNTKMSIIQPVIEKMKEIIPDLPGDWADIISQRMGIRKEVIRAYANGRRGKRDKLKVLEVLRQMKTLQQEIKKEIEKETA